MRHPRVSEDSKTYSYTVEFFEKDGDWQQNFEHGDYGVAHSAAENLHNSYGVSVRIVQTTESIIDMFEQDSTE